MNVKKIREDFPILASGVIYFDNAASSLTPEPVLRKEAEFYHEYRANIHRGAHRLTLRASQEYEAVYVKLAKFFNARESEFVNVRNATEALNAAVMGLEWKAGDEIVTTSVEHHSCLLPLVRLQKERGVKLKIVQANNEGLFSEKNFAPLVSKKTKLVAFTACSNVLGTRVPIKEITRVAHDAGALVLLDAAQYAGHHAMNLKDLGVDFMAFSGHKFLAPTGTGVLYHREGVDLKPVFVGGGTIQDASARDYALLANRERFEAGTPNIAGWIALGAALDYASKIGLREIEEHEALLSKELFKVFRDFENRGVDWYGPRDERDKSAPVFAFNIRGLKHHETAVMLDELKKICVRSGHHCCIPLTRALGVDGTVRASLYFYNTIEEINAFRQALETVSKLAKN